MRQRSHSRGAAFPAMRRWATTILLCAALTACTSSTPEPPESGSDSSPQPTPDDFLRRAGTVTETSHETPADTALCCGPATPTQPR